MMNGTSIENTSRSDSSGPSEPRPWSIPFAIGIALAFVFVTRWPVARTSPMEADEFGYLNLIKSYWFPMHHTLFLTSGRLLGQLAGDAYEGFILLDIASSALALASVWWWLRALVRPSVALGATLLLGVGPSFWGYGSVAANYTAIVLVGAFLLGIAVRDQARPRAWHPYAAAAVLAIGTGYRPDIGVFWLPILFVIVWKHRWKRAILAGILFTIMNLAWIGAMLYDVGGWTRYRAATGEFGHETWLLNSIWHLGLIDGPLRYSVKIGMGLLWTLGPALVFAPRGFARLRRSEHGGFLCLLVGLSIAPALVCHLLIHFGVIGYGFHHIPGLIALIALGIGRPRSDDEAVRAPRRDPLAARGDRSVPRLIGVAAMMAMVFLVYPTDCSAPGWRGDFDLAFCRYTRIGLASPISRVPTHWRTANSRDLAGNPLPGSSPPSRWQ
jgi:hypothetical protein